MISLSELRLALWIALLAGLATAATATPLQKFDSLDSRTDIQLQVKEGIEVGGRKPGFRLSLSGWPPSAAFDVHGLDATGTRVELVPDVATDAKGTASVPVPYESPGLHPGSWVIEVSGKDVDRAERLQIPRVIHGKHGWRLDFRNADKKDPAPPS